MISLLIHVLIGILLAFSGVFLASGLLIPRFDVLLVFTDVLKLAGYAIIFLGLWRFAKRANKRSD